MKDHFRHSSIFYRNKNDIYGIKHAIHAGKTFFSSIDNIKIKTKIREYKKYRLKTGSFSPVFPLTSAILVPLANELVLAQYPDESSEPIRSPGDGCSRDAGQTNH